MDSTLIGLRLDPDALAWLDAERGKLDPQPSRPEMVRRLLDTVKKGADVPGQE